MILEIFSVKKKAGRYNPPGLFMILLIAQRYAADTVRAVEH